MSVTKPTSVLDWANSPPSPSDVAYPATAIEDAGYAENDPLPHEEFNGIMARVSEWVQFVDDSFGASGQWVAGISNGELTLADDGANDVTLTLTATSGSASLVADRLSLDSVDLDGEGAPGGVGTSDAVVARFGTNGELRMTVDSASEIRLEFEHQDVGGASDFRADTIRGSTAQLGTVSASSATISNNATVGELEVTDDLDGTTATNLDTLHQGLLPKVKARISLDTDGSGNVIVGGVTGYNVTGASINSTGTPYLLNLSYDIVPPSSADFYSIMASGYSSGNLDDTPILAQVRNSSIYVYSWNSTTQQWDDLLASSLPANRTEVAVIHYMEY